MKKINVRIVFVIFCALFLFGCGSQGEILTELETVLEEAASEGTAAEESAPEEIPSEEIPSEEAPPEESAAEETISEEIITAEAVPQKTASEAGIKEDGIYTSKEDVALYLHTYGKLPSNYITKKAAQERGWDNRKNTMAETLPGMSIGGDHFGNYDKKLPEKKGRSYKECDIDYVKGGRNAKRIIFSNDGLIYYTGDHYNTFEQLY